jgi:hypothetical protein
MNATYKQKLGDAVISVGTGFGWIVGTIVCTVVLFACVVGKKAFSQAEKWAEKGQAKMAGKAAENFTEAGINVKEAYNLYRQDSIEEKTTKEEEAELVELDEGYHSGSEKLKA